MSIYSNICEICGKNALIKKDGKISRTCGISCQAKLSRKLLKEDPVRFAKFVTSTKAAVTKIWKERSPEERNRISAVCVESTNRYNSTLSDDERLKKYSRYHTCDPETIERLNKAGREQCAKNLKSGKSGFVTTYKGRFTPKNITKYKGDWQNVIFRSLWERQVMKYLDENPMVVEWSSEELAIPYISPKDNMVHRYFPDMVVKVQQPDGTIKTFLWEIKPYAETIEPKADPMVLKESGRSAKKRRYVRDVFKYAINRAKWNAAIKFCESQGWTFHLITEKHLKSLTQ